MFTRGHKLAETMAGSSNLHARTAVPTRFAFPRQGEQSALKVKKQLIALLCKFVGQISDLALTPKTSLQLRKLSSLF